MSRNKKVTSQEIIDTINDNGSITIDEIAKIFKICKETVRNRLRELRDDGEKIFFDSNGLFIMENVDSEEDKNTFAKYVKWILRTLKGVSKCGKITKPFMLECKKELQELLTKEERKVLSKNVSAITRVLDYLEIEDEMEE